MKALVLYDSVYGNTAQIAHAVAGALDDAAMALDTTIQTVSARLAAITALGEYKLAGYDLLVLGCPTHFHDLPVTTRTLLDQLQPETLDGQRMAAFDTRYPLSTPLSGSAATILAKRLRAQGASLLLPPESFFVTGREGPLLGGECERAAHWGQRLRERLVAPCGGSD